MPEEKRKILFVDDDSFLRKVYDAELSEQKFDVVLAVDGQDGLDKAHSEDPDLIILDMIMPKKNGLEVLQEMKKNPALKNLFTVIFTSSKNKDNILSAYSLGANSYIQKPSQIEKFKTGIQMILEYWFRWVEYPYNTV